MNHTESIVWRSAINDCPPLDRRLGTCSSRQKAPRRRARARKRRQQTHICRGSHQIDECACPTAHPSLCQQSLRHRGGLILNHIALQHFYHYGKDSSVRIEGFVP